MINHQYSAKKIGKYVEIHGKYDINIWYSYQQQSKTAVHTETFSYKDRIKLHYRDEDIIDSNDIKTKVLQQPNCVEATIAPNGDCFEVIVEREFLVEVIGETLVTITVHPNDFEEEWHFDESSSSSSSSSSSDERGHKRGRGFEEQGHGRSRGFDEQESSGFDESSSL